MVPLSLRLIILYEIGVVFTIVCSVFSFVGALWRWLSTGGRL